MVAAMTAAKHHGDDIRGAYEELKELVAECDRDELLIMMATLAAMNNVSLGWLEKLSPGWDREEYFKEMGLFFAEDT